MNEYWISTVSGKKFDYVDLKPEQFDINDIATALSHIPRWCGQIDKNFSVAEHCVNVASLLAGDDKFWGLMHDAAEAYISDIPKPFKWLIPQIEEVEFTLQDAIVDKWDIPISPEIVKRVKKVDRIMLVTEDEQLRSRRVDWGYYEDIEPADITLQFWNPLRAKNEFLAVFKKAYERNKERLATAEK